MLVRVAGAKGLAGKPKGRLQHSHDCPNIAGRLVGVQQGLEGFIKLLMRWLEAMLPGSSGGAAEDLQLSAMKAACSPKGAAFGWLSNCLATTRAAGAGT